MPARLDEAALLGAAMAAYQLCTSGPCLAPAWRGCVIRHLLGWILIAMRRALWLKERPTPATRIALLLAVAGTGMILAGPRAAGAAPVGFAAGALAALGAGVSYAVYAVTAKELLRRIAPLSLAALTFTLAAVLLTPVLVLERGAAEQLARGWPLLVYLGVVPTAVAYVVFGAGLRRVTATAAGIATLLEPLTAAALGVLVSASAWAPAGRARRCCSEPSGLLARSSSRTSDSDPAARRKTRTGSSTFLSSRRPGPRGRASRRAAVPSPLR
jgi:DME family drug/metabolite transporter